MKCICIMFDNVPQKVRERKPMSADEETSLWWQESIKTMANFHFLELLLNFDKDGMSPESVEAIDYYTSLP